MAAAAADLMADEIARTNGFDPTGADITVTTTYSISAGVVHAEIQVEDRDVGLTFGRLVLDRVEIRRSAEAVLSDCQALCGPEIVMDPPFDGFLDTGTGGDGWGPALAGDLIFNLFHHNSGRVLMCVDPATGTQCPGYPVEPYADIKTNYAPPLTAISTRVYFVVQQPNSVGLGCWDGATHNTCFGFSTPLVLAAYDANSNRANTRVAGPELSGGRLYMYGDDNRMHCVDPNTGGFCSGYPHNTALAGVHDMSLEDGPAGFAGGVVTDDGQQFDMVAGPGGRIYTTLTPADGATWIGCWDTTSSAPCSGWPAVSTQDGRPWVFLSYDTVGTVDGVCARAGNRGDGEVGSGHECFSLGGTSTGSPIPFVFGTKGFDKAGQQSATGVTSTGHTVSYFPMRNQSGAACYDWTTRSSCAIAPSNWNGTQEYAYIHDGSGCVYALGHSGKLWSFSIDTGQMPCQSPGSISATIQPCGCADGVTTRWTELAITSHTDLAHFEEFVVDLYLPDGTLLDSVDLVAAETMSIDLRYLNDWGIPPSYLDLQLAVTIIDGMEDLVFAPGLEPGVLLTPGIRPSLVD